MAFDNLLIDRDGAVALLTINRPQVLNALNTQTLDEIRHAVLDLKHDDSVRVIVITGAGDKSFVAGADINELAVQTPSSGREHALAGQHVFDLIENMGKPVIAAVNGYALGGGCEIAMACHLRLLKEGARMGQTESNLGIIPGFGGTQRMSRLIGRAKSLEFMILGTQIPAAECLALGLVNRVSKDGQTLDDAKALARQIAKRPPIATRLIIEAVDDGLEAPIDQALEIETRAFMKVLRTEDASEGIQAFFGKREAQFKGK